MALSQQTKDRVNQALDKGQWYIIIKLIVQFGLELIEYLKERKIEKNETK